MTPTTTFTQTLMQKILGRNYKWWYIFKFNTKKAMSGMVANFIFSLSIIIYILGVLFVWSRNGSNAEIITYLLIGKLYISITKTFLIQGTSGIIFDGRIVKYLILPTDFIKYNFFAILGRRSIRNIAEIFATILAVILYLLQGGDVLFGNLYNSLFLILFISVSFTLSYFIEIIISFLAFFIRDPREFVAAENIFSNIVLVFFGGLIPMNLLPGSNFLYFLPLSWLIHHPMQIYLGKYDTNQTILVFLGGIIWCMVLYFLAKLVFRLGLKKNESVGL